MQQHPLPERQDRLKALNPAFQAEDDRITFRWSLTGGYES
jgi:hypothetical protein